MEKPRYNQMFKLLAQLITSIRYESKVQLLD